MRILMLDNTNNVNFELGISLSKLGHKVTLILFQPGLLHHPKSIDRFYRIKKILKLNLFKNIMTKKLLILTQYFLINIKLLSRENLI